jgi:hypothetical protein
VCEQLDGHASIKAVFAFTDEIEYESIDQPLSGNACVLAFSKSTARRLTSLSPHKRTVDGGAHSTYGDIEPEQAN